MTGDIFERSAISSVDLTFRLIDELQQRDGSTITPLASAFDVSKSTIYRHLVTLRKHGYVTKEGETYYVGLRWLDLGMYAQSRKKVYDLTGEKTADIAEQTGERAQFIVEENGHGIHVHSEIGKNGVRTGTGVGVRVPMHVTSAGKAMLAYMPNERVRTILDTHGLDRLTDNSTTSRSALKAELEQVREQGVAFNRAERVAGIFSVGVPIQDETEVYGGLSVTGPTHRMTDERVAELSDLLLGLAEEVELKIQYSEI